MSNISRKYVLAIFVFALLAIVGAWLPWAQVIPTATTPWKTSVPPAETLSGFVGSIPQVIIPSLVSLTVGLVSYYKHWRPDWVLVLSAIPIFYSLIVEFNHIYYHYDGLMPAPGMFLTLAGGLGFLLIGGKNLLERRGFLRDW